jgi:hypothetical protein
MKFINYFLFLYFLTKIFKAKRRKCIRKENLPDGDNSLDSERHAQSTLNYYKES